MATFYPLISGNASTSGGSSKFDFTTYTDNDFDVYVFEESPGNNDAGPQTAYMVFTIKNTATETGAELDIYNINGNADFDSLGYSLDYTEAGESIPHLGPDGSANNKIKASASATNSATNAQATACASGATGFLGIGSQLSDTDDNSNYQDNDHASELNAAGSANCRPIYSSSNIIANTIPINSYCCFVVRFKPTSAFSGEFVNPRLTITNSNATKIINFTANAVNILTYRGTIGTASEGVTAGASDSFSASAETILDTQTISLGLHPVGHVPDETNRTVELGDLSTNPGNYGYYKDPMGFASRVFDNMAFMADGAVYQPDVNHADMYQRFANSIRHGYNYVEQLHNCAGKTNDGGVFLDELASTGSTGTIYKNWSYLPIGEQHDTSENHINFRSTHTNQITYLAYDDYFHTTAADVTNKVYHRIGDILNTDYPAQTDDNSNNQAFVYGVEWGFYNKLSMQSDQVTQHFWGGYKLADASSLQNWEKRFYNIWENQTSPASIITGQENPPYVRSDNGAMFRTSIVPVNIAIRYNYFGVDNGEVYKLPEFAFSQTGTNGVAISGKNSTTGNVNPTYYETGANDWTYYGRYGADNGGIGTSTDNVTYTEFNDTANNGTILSMLYEIAPNINASHLYTPYNGSGYTASLDNKKELPHGIGGDAERNDGKSDMGLYGVYSIQMRIAHSYYENIFKQGFGSWNTGSSSYTNPLMKWRIGYFPVPSKLTLVASDEVKNTSGEDISLSWKLWLHGNVHTYTMPTEAIPVSNWYRIGDTATKTSNVADRNYSDSSLVNDLLEGTGEWYGAGGLTVNHPYCWNQASSSQVYADYDGTNPGYRIKHAPTSKFIKTGATEFYKEHDEGVNFYFKLDDAKYDTQDQTYKSIGRLYFHNTGDQPIFVQSVSIGTATGASAVGKLDGNIFYGFGGSMLLPASNIHFKPAFTTQVIGGTSYVGKNNTSSNDPEWKVSRATGLKAFDGNSSAHQMGNAVDVFSTDDAGTRHALDIADDHSSPNGNTSGNATNHYFNQTHNSTINVSSGSKRMFIPALQTGQNLDDTQCYAADDNSNFVNVTFKLTPKQDSALDQGDYYAVIQYSYYVGDYENRYQVFSQSTEEFGSDMDEGLSIGFKYNNQTRLHVSRYLVKCKVQSVGNIEVTDTEGDAAPDTVVLPNISIG